VHPIVSRTRSTARTRGVAPLVAVALAVVAAAPAGAAPRRVVALTPFTANTLAALDVRPVGIGAVLGGAERLSPKLAGVPRLPLSHPNGPNLEQLAQLRPQLVLSTPAWRRGEAGMRTLGAAVRESEPTRVADVAAETRRIGRLVGRSKRAKRVAGRQAARIAAATRGVTSHPSVLLVLGVGRTPYAFLPSSWGGDVVRAAGGRLLTAGLASDGGYARISDEVVVARDPDVIIAVPHGNPSDIGRLAAYYRNNPAWRTTKAVRNGRVYVAVGNSLLQAFTDPDRTIRDVQAKYLHNR
jgi:iron complex transport system substrate-binding protein